MSRIEDGGAVEAGLVERLTFLADMITLGEKIAWGAEPMLMRAAAAEITRLRAENETIRTAIAWANNSLYGSHGFFLSTNGGEPDEHHLDRPIEDLKSEARKAHRLRAENAGMREALDGIANTLSALRMQAEKDGGGRDGRLGAFLSNDIAYLIRIAALSKASQAEGQTP